MILVDTTIWINHLRWSDERLGALLNSGQVLIHAFVVAEIALGHLSQRASILSDLQGLPHAVSASHEEVLEMIERERLFGRGIGYIDAHLLAAVRLTPEARLWTDDRRLRDVAARLGVAALLDH